MLKALRYAVRTLVRTMPGPSALPLTRSMRALPFRAPPFDVATFSMVALALVAVAATASYWPARRATRVDPVTVRID